MPLHTQVDESSQDDEVEVNPVYVQELGAGIPRYRLPAHGMHSCRRDFDIFAITNQTPKEPFRDGAAANVARADKENAFHDWRRASARMNNLKSNMIKST